MFTPSYQGEASTLLYQGEVRDDPYYKWGFKDREHGLRSNARRVHARKDKKAYLIGYLSERHREV